MSGLPDSDVSDDEMVETLWNYVWPKEMIKHFMKTNNQKK